MYRIDKLMRQKDNLFHTQDLGLMWGIVNQNTLYTTIKRHVQRGILIPIHKGFYSTIPFEEIDPLKLAIGYIHRFAYISCETVLIKEGVIFQKVNSLTLVSDISKKFTIAGNSFWVRKMKDEFLYNDYGIINIEGIKTASLERAVVDMIYFNQNVFFDNRKVVDWKKVKKIQKEMGYI